MPARLLLAVLLTQGAPDGGVLVDGDGGVVVEAPVRVAQAVLPDGGTVGPGWHLTDERMRAVGEALVAAENAKREALNRAAAAEQRAQQCLVQPASGWGFGAGFAIGFVAGSGLVGYTAVKVAN